MAKKKKKKKVFKIKNILIILVSIFSICGLFYLAITMPVNNIYISGNNIVSDDEILELSGLDSYPSFLLTSKSNIRDLIRENKYIKDVKIKKKMGNKFYVEVEEYKVIALNDVGNVILSSGEILENSYELYDVPKLITPLDSEVYDYFVDKFSEIDTDVLRSISEIEYSPALVDGDRFLLYMSDGNLVHVTLTKINKINKYNGIKDVLDGRYGIIYLDSGDYVELKG